jgi:hydrogenase maturation protease
VLVAGVGNVFLGDDGFGVEVVRHLAGTPLPDGVELFDVGVRAVHLAYELLDGCDLLIVVDAAARGEPPGTVTVLEVEPAHVAAGQPSIDAHSLTADSVLALVGRLGANPGRTLVVACEPAALAPGMELSSPVRAAVPEAARLIGSIVGSNAGSNVGANVGR